MSRLIYELNSWGCNTTEAMKIMGNDEEFYAECLHDIVEDKYFDVLKKALDTEDVSLAFDAAHTLKGVLANVGLSPMYDKVVEIVEPLRKGNAENLNKKYDQLINMREKLEDILNEN